MIFQLWSVNHPFLKSDLDFHHVILRHRWTLGWNLFFKNSFTTNWVTFFENYSHMMLKTETFLFICYKLAKLDQITFYCIKMAGKLLNLNLASLKNKQNSHFITKNSFSNPPNLN